jgi:N-methylhydantoinase A
MRDAAALDAATLGALLDALARRADAAGAGERRWWLRTRYVGQGHELDVPAAPGDDGGTVSARFTALHARRAGFTLDRSVEVVSARASVSGAAHAPTFGRAAAPAGVAAPFAVDEPAGRYVDAGVALDAVVRGPATVALPDATLLVPAGWTARALPIGGWMVEHA